MEIWKVVQTASRLPELENGSLADRLTFSILES